MSEPTDELREVVTIAIADAFYAWPGFHQAANAAISAYEAHRPRPVVVLSREEWEAALDVAEGIMILRDYRFDVATIREIQTDAIRAAFPWIKVEGDA